MNFKWMTKPILNLFRYHKLKGFTVLISALFFFIIFFPFSDLSLFISSSIAQNTRNQVILNFDQLILKLLPSPGFQFSQVVVDTPYISGLEVQEMTLLPSLPALLTGNVGVTAYLDGTMGGNINVFVKTLGFNEQGPSKINAKIQTQSIQLKQLLESTSFNLDMDGIFNIQGQGEWDLSFETQPDFKLRTQAQNFQIQSLSVPTQIGPLSLPSIALKEILIQMGLKEGQLQVEVLDLGRTGDDLTAQINGYLNVQFRQGVNGVQMLPGNYNLACRLTLNPALETQFKVFLDVLSLSKYKKGRTYAFRITGNPNQIPNIRGL